MTPIVFDIETGPLPTVELMLLMPPFNPADVKMGNLKDPDKISAKLAEAEADHVGNFIERAALDALTGRVLAIGCKVGDGGVGILCDDDEAALLRAFWETVSGETGRLAPLVGFNILNFDLPFLIKRSWKHGIRPPYLRKGRYWVDGITDVRDVWQLGDRMARGSLDAVAKHLGLGAKTGSGAAFARLLVEDREAALAYLVNDVELTAAVALRIGVVL